MKKLIRITAPVCLTVISFMLNACSKETKVIQTKNDHLQAQKETIQQATPEFLVQQFGGCKAHR